jgi:hypothetical protein
MAAGGCKLTLNKGLNGKLNGPSAGTREPTLTTLTAKMRQRAPISGLPENGSLMMGKSGKPDFRARRDERANYTRFPALQRQKSRPSSRMKRASTMLCTSDAPSTSRAARAAR